MNFDFYNPVKLISGKGCVKSSSGLIASYGKKCMIVTDGVSAQASGAFADMTQALESEGVSYVHYGDVQQNPLLTSAKEAADIAKKEGVAFVIGIGGGSPIDSAKATCVFATNDIPLMDIYTNDWPNKPLPLISVGTASGTGAEVCSTAVMTTPEGKKIAFKHDSVLPVINFGDAAYTATLPLRFTVSTALDALCHAMESYFNTRANAFSDMFAIESVRMLVQDLKTLSAIKDIKDISFELRERFYLASLYAGYALNICGTNFCHALSYIINEQYGVPHGTACVVYLPHFIRRNQKLVPEKSAAFFKAVGTSPDELAELAGTMHDCPKFKFSKDVIAAMAERASGSKIAPNCIPTPLTYDESVSVLTELFGELM